VDNYDKATREEITEMGLLTQAAMKTLRAMPKAQGFNIGMNQGEIAGAGIASHLHQHIVPRWKADANFFPVIAQTKALPRLLGEVRESIAKNWISEA
jgi:ATP adenylyltransferase